MKIIHLSEYAKVSKTSTDTYENMEIHVFTQFFIHRSHVRNAEIQECLRRNTLNPNITKIHLINERIYTTEELGNNTSSKICQIVTTGKRLKYQDVFSYIRKHNIIGFHVITNSDIFFDDSLGNLGISEISEQKKMFALLRYEYTPQPTIKDITPSHTKDFTIFPSDVTIFGPRFDSQDTWIFHSKFPITEKQERAFNYEFGKPGCDNKIAYLISILGYEILNDPTFIKTYHYHTEQKRDYNAKDVIPNPWAIVTPAGYNPMSLVQSLGIHLGDCAQKTRNFKEIRFNDNKRLYNYVAEKCAENTPFIIPRISGIENNVAVFSRIGKKNGTFSQDVLNYLRQIAPVMKNNAGIKLSNMNSIIKYSDMYLSAFEKCDVFCGWESHGGVYPHIAQSHDFMMSQYLTPERSCVWACALDIFHYIYNQPWTTAMAGKRILIISSFSKSIQEKLTNRALLYDGVDLFPNCEFVVIRPPQTQANENSQEFDIELERFQRELDKIRDTYDIALVSCGGYANLVCNYIFENHKKSAIYVGGVLQMYFGIIGSRWYKERSDVVRLFLNEHWSRPKEDEKPRGSEQVEKGCYW